jgi:hypothetical protein
VRRAPEEKPSVCVPAGGGESVEEAELLDSVSPAEPVITGIDVRANPDAGFSFSNPEPDRLSPPMDERKERVCDAPPDPLVGGFGCLGCPFEDAADGGLDGGGTVPVPSRPAVLGPPPTLATAPAPLPEPAPAVPDRAAAPPAAAAIEPAPNEATVAAPAITPVAVPNKSPPVSAGEPPNTAAKSFGACQHNIRKISAEPMMPKAPIAGGS